MIYHSNPNILKLINFGQKLWSTIRCSTVGVGDGVGLGVGEGVGLGVGDGVGLGVGEGVLETLESYSW